MTNLAKWRQEEQRTVQMQKLMQILASKISHVFFMQDKFTHFRRLFPQIADELQSISICEFNVDLNCEQWLMKGRADGNQKILHLRTNALKRAEIGQIKKVKNEFLLNV